MDIFSNNSSKYRNATLGGTPLLCNDPQRRQYLGVSYTRRQVNVQSIVLAYRSYSYPLVSITTNRRADSTGCTAVTTACCFYTTNGERHTTKTCWVHQLTALLPLDGQLSRTYTTITTVVQKYLDGTQLLLKCRCKYNNALHANID